MNKMDKKTAIAIIVALVVVLYFIGSSLLTKLYSNNQSDTLSINTNQQTKIMEDTTSTNDEQALQIQDVIVGEGVVAEAGDTISVNYVGTLTDGSKFDSSIDRGEPLSFTLGVGQVIKGWDQGVVGMKVGGERKLTIAPSLAYGDAPDSFALKNETLHFDVTLLDVKKGQHIIH